MAWLEDLIALLIILLLAFAIYMHSSHKSLRDIIVEIRGGFK